jgi:peptide/nickel transport system substrate-binding protein
MRRVLACATLLACLSVLAHQAAAQNLTIALRQDPDILDPTLSRTYVGRIVYAGLCDKLFDIDAKLNVVPQLATGYEWTDPRTLTIHLRPDVTFQDGERMDAEAVKYSLERHLTMQGSFRRSEIALMDHVDVIDPQTVRIVLSAPSVPFLYQLTDRAGMMVSPKAARAGGKDFGLHPVCAGPFSFTERVQQDHITLQRFPGYWNASAIHFDRVTYRIIYDASVRLSNIRAGAVDIADLILPTDADTVRRDPKLNLLASDELGYMGITINTGNGPRAQTPLGRDARVRQAFALAIDRDALNQVVYNGAYTPDVQAVPALSPFYIADYKPPARDVARAKALLKEAGVTTPLKVEMMTPTDSDIRQVGEVIQSMAAEAGFDVKLTAVEFASSLQQASRGEFEAYIVGWSGRPDIDGNLWPFLHTGGGQNDGHFSNAEADALLDEARTEADLAQRRATYAKFWQIAAREQPIVYLWTRKNLFAASKRVIGFEPLSDGMIRLQGVSLRPQ